MRDRARRMEPSPYLNRVGPSLSQIPGMFRLRLFAPLFTAGAILAPICAVTGETPVSHWISYQLNVHGPHSGPIELCKQNALKLAQHRLAVHDRYHHAVVEQHAAQMGRGVLSFAVR